ncbi:MAG: HAD-IIB family hydrolase [Lachnospiraceae bacterium]|nr:HAD-IIB family hydrolase [Lachnospiraceae bacterium]
MSNKMKIAGRLIGTVVCDLDGTLLPRGQKLPTKEAMDAFETLLDAGIRVIIASGRQYCNMHTLFGPLADRMIMVSENGTYAAYRGEVLLEEAMDNADGLAVIREIGERTAAGVWQQETAGAEDAAQAEDGMPDIVVATRSMRHLIPYHEAFAAHLHGHLGGRTEEIEDYAQIEEPFLQISVKYPKQVPACELEHYRTVYGERLALSDSGDGWMDVIRKGCGKGPALQEIADRMGFSTQEMMVFGDSGNDVGMFRIAGLRIGMNRGSDEIKALSDALCERVEDVLTKCAAQCSEGMLLQALTELYYVAGCEELSPEETRDDRMRQGSRIPESTARQIMDRAAERARALWYGSQAETPEGTKAAGIRDYPGIRAELEHFLRTGDFLDEWRSCGISLTDLIVWQVDHFKAYMDREENNRYHRERLFLEALENMLRLETDPEPVLRKLREESGQDQANADL